MLTELIGKKLQMTQVWKESGEIVPVTVLQAGPCQVVQVKTEETKDGYRAVQLGFEDKKTSKGTLGKNMSKAEKGHFAKSKVDPKRLVQEVPLPEGTSLKSGDTVTVEIFKECSHVDVTGTTKGRGFQGVIKRHDFSRGPKSHGSKHYRGPGSTGQHQGMSKVRKGKHMPGHYGSEQVTTMHLEVVKVEAERNLLYVKGAVPGPSGSYLKIRKSILS
ncbi:MAG: 50S ribosomal protein L3 [Planctomycetota bacterium]|nr:50S ribosomal protein L3 [Planctomycetota bacterium]